MTKMPEANSPSPSSSARPYKRRIRNLFIHKPMQREFIFVVISLLIVSSLAIAYIIHSTLHEASAGGGFEFGKLSPYEVLSNATYHLSVRVTLVLFATLVVISFFGLFFLHRVAGPVYRFHRIFLRINDDDMPAPIKLREGDFFSEMAAEINRLISKLQFEKTRKKLLQEKIQEFLAGRPSDKEAVKFANDLKSLLAREPEE